MEEQHPFDIKVDRVGDLTYVRLSGDAVWVWSIWQAVEPLARQRLDYVIDLRGLRHIDMNGVDDLMQAARWGMDFELDVSFIPGNPEVQDEIRTIVSEAVFGVFPWVEPPGEPA